MVEKLIQKNCADTLGFYALKFNPEDSSKIELSLLFVSPDYIRQGIGTILYAQAKNKAKSLGASYMYWISDPDAQLFYTKLGASLMGTDQNLLNPNTQVYLFSVRLD